MGRDLPLYSLLLLLPNFNPLSPHGERRGGEIKAFNINEFQSTLPAWGETGVEDIIFGVKQISIHSPRMGRDSVFSS